MVNKYTTIIWCVVVQMLFYSEAIAQITMQPLPQDETEAYQMLNDGSLDSAIWKTFSSFYEQPLCVPCGELANLIDVVPELAHSLPYSTELLVTYEPWKKQDVQRLFSDYPILSNLKPILSFETSKSSSIGRVQANIRKNPKSEPSQSIEFLITPNSLIKMRGKSQISSGYATWQKRAVTACTASSGKLTFGNFNLDLDNGLFYGYFPAKAIDSVASDNWRYAQLASWNGVLYEGRLGSKIKENVFFHSRRSETAYGIQCQTSVSNTIAITASVSRLMTTAESSAKSDSTIFGDAGISLKNSAWSAGAFMGAAQEHGVKMPIYLFVKNSTHENAFDLSYFWYPQGISASRSALLQGFLKKIHEPDSISPGAQSINFALKLPVTKAIQSNSGVSYYYSNSIHTMAAEGFVGVSGKTWIDFSIRYRYRPSTSAETDQHFLSAVCGYQVFPLVRFGLPARVVWTPESYKSLYLRPNLSILSGKLEWVAFCAMYSVQGNAFATSFGMVQTLRVTEKTWGEIKVEIPVTQQNTDGWVLDAKAVINL